jgi:CubicO group peptidase (beta-lactamase class C family)
MTFPRSLVPAPILWLLVVSSPASGQPSAIVPSADTLRLDPGAVEAWVDAQVTPALAISGMPGAVVVVAQRSGVILTKGYGLANVAAKTPLDAQTTLVNIASIGKSMTAMITAQLVHEGVLDLDQDVNRYLTSAQVRGPTVTLRMLLGHRGGFDDDITGLLVPFDGDIRMSRGELDRRLRPLVEPGIATAYDNQGYGVIGLVLRDVTGKPLDQLFRERLFDPAGMTGAVHGRPADGKTRLARCYTVQGPGVLQECEYWLYKEGMMGAGGVAASGADMARYLRLLLGGGTIDGRQVVTPAAFADVTNFDHYRFHPGMPGGGRAFIQFEEFRGREYAHSGSIPGFSSMMKIYPDADVAIHVTFLGGQPGGFDLTVSNVVRSLRQVSVRAEARPGLDSLRTLTDRFADRFIPAGRPRSSEGAAPAPSGEARLDDFLGPYVIASNHSRTFVSRFGGWGGLIHLERTADSGVRLAGIPELGDYRKVAPLLYENAKGDRLALATTPAGRMMAIGLSGGIFRQTNPIESPAWSLPTFAIALLLALTALVQLRRGAPLHLRRLAAGCLLGVFLVLGGLLAEWEWGVRLGIVEGSIFWPALWRLGLHGGVVLLLWRAIGFLRVRGVAIGWVGYGHGLVLALSAIAIAVTTLAWRVVGAFPPYFSW